MKHLLFALLLACGGDAFDIPDVQDVEQAFRPDRAKNWCCEGTRAGVPVLGCGLSLRPDESTTCYCSGVVSADTEECRDGETFTPGTFCTSADLVCW